MVLKKVIVGKKASASRGKNVDDAIDWYIFECLTLFPFFAENSSPNAMAPKW